MNMGDNINLIQKTKTFIKENYLLRVMLFISFLIFLEVLFIIYLNNF